jgi:hypothetical protein
LNEFKKVTDTNWNIFHKNNSKLFTSKQLVFEWLSVVDDKERSSLKQMTDGSHKLSGFQEGIHKQFVGEASIVDVFQSIHPSFFSVS